MAVEEDVADLLDRLIYELSVGPICTDPYCSHTDASVMVIVDRNQEGHVVGIEVMPGLAHERRFCRFG